MTYTLVTQGDVALSCGGGNPFSPPEDAYLNGQEGVPARAEKKMGVA